MDSIFIIMFKCFFLSVLNDLAILTQVDWDSVLNPVINDNRHRRRDQLRESFKNIDKSKLMKQNN